MNNEPTASALTDSQISERLAKFMEGKWKNHGLPFGSASRILAKKCVEGDWNLWREVEEKVMEDKNLWAEFSYSFFPKGDYTDQCEAMPFYMKAPLRTRCRALLSALDSLNA